MVLPDVLPDVPLLLNSPYTIYRPYSYYNLVYTHSQVSPSLIQTPNKKCDCF